MQILVTGASGLVGAEAIARLLKAGHTIVALVHSVGNIVTNDGALLPSKPYTGGRGNPGELLTVKGDLQQDGLGLDPELYKQLQSSVDRVLHSAALTSFGRPEERYEAINVAGTQRMIDFATKKPGACIPFIYISTMYVCGERPGIFSETAFDRGQSFGSPYEASKFRAESLIRKARDNGLPTVIVRPAIIVGDSASGIMRKFDTIYAVYRITTAGLVRTIPGDYGATLDIVPIDWVADGVVAALENFHHAEGRTLHLCSDQPLALREINDVCALFPSFNVPRFVPGHVFHSYEMKGLEKRYYDEVISLYESYFRRQAIFVRDATRDIFAKAPPAQGKELLHKIFSYAVKVGYFRRTNHEI
jgi:nucleoside-diphosphate-sugar epimerase